MWSVSVLGEPAPSPKQICWLGAWLKPDRTHESCVNSWQFVLLIIDDGNDGNNDDDQERKRSQINGWRRSLGPPAAKCATHHVCYCSRHNHSLWLKHIYHGLCILLMTANVCLGSSLQRFSWLRWLSETWIAFLKSQKMSNSLFSEDLSSKTIESINHMIIMFYSISHKNTRFLSVNIFALRWDYYLDTQQIFWHHSHFNYLVSSQELSKKQYSWRKLRIICDISEYYMQTHKFGDTAETIDSAHEK